MKKENNKSRESKKNRFLWNGITFFIFVPLYLFLVWILIIANNRVPVTIDFLDFTILSVAVLRLTRLFVYDKVTEFIRDFFAKRDDGLSQNLTQLFGCPWCLSMWFALFIVFIYYLSPVFYTFILILAVAGFASLIQLIISLLNRIAKK